MPTIAVANMVSPKSQHASTKPCTSASCCSPSRVWKSIQLFINTDNREEFRKICNDAVKLPHLVHVILSSRLSNNPLVYKTTMKIDPRLCEKFGKLSATDLNALELALLQKHEHIAYTLLQTLKQNATPAQCKQFLGHQWGKQGNTALHLASFWGMSKLVRLMLEMEADPTIQNNRQLRPIDCTTHSDIITQLQPNNVVKQRPSLLLKKAEKLIRPLQTLPDQYFMEELRAPLMSPLSFSSSSSSSSSLSSFDQHCWTPPASPIPHMETPLSMSLLISNKPEKVVAEEDEDKEVLVVEREVNDPVLFSRPGCFPRRQDSHRTVTIDSAHKQEERAVSRKQKKVQFDPETILIEACIRGDKEEIIDQQQQQNLDLYTIRDIRNRSLLHIALFHGHEDLVDYLFDKIDINHSDNKGWTCLHYAAYLGLWRSLQFLASLAHCNVNARTNDDLRVEQCPDSEFRKKKCKIMLERLARNTARKSPTLNRKQSVNNF